MRLTEEFKKQYTPDRVKELCEDQRWSKNGITPPLSMGSFGNVPEVFKEIAQTFPEGSDAREAYMNAAQEASDIYKQQILSDIRKFSAGKPREELEEAANRMRKVSDLQKRFSEPAAGRSMWSSYMIGDWYMKNNPSRDGGKLVSGKDQNGVGYKQFRIK